MSQVLENCFCPSRVPMRNIIVLTFVPRKGSNSRRLCQGLEDVHVGAQGCGRQHVCGQSRGQHSRVLFMKRTIFLESRKLCSILGTVFAAMGMAVRWIFKSEDRNLSKVWALSLQNVVQN